LAPYTIRLRNAQLTKEQERGVQAVLALDLEPMVYTLITPRYGNPSQMTLAEADRAVMLYKMFLILCLLYPKENIVPPLPADDVWHLHILDTFAYAPEITLVFGFFLHHYPYVGLRGEQDVKLWNDLYARTQGHYLYHFDVDLSGVSAGGTCSGGGPGGGKCMNNPPGVSADGVAAGVCWDTDGPADPSGPKVDNRPRPKRELVTV
jgi:hypothetical protein